MELLQSEVTQSVVAPDRCEQKAAAATPGFG